MILAFLSSLDGISAPTVTEARFFERSFILTIGSTIKLSALPPLILLLTEPEVDSDIETSLLGVSPGVVGTGAATVVELPSVVSVGGPTDDLDSSASCWFRGGATSPPFRPDLDDERFPRPEPLLTVGLPVTGLESPVVAFVVSFPPPVIILPKPTIRSMEIPRTCLRPEEELGRDLIFADVGSGGGVGCSIGVVAELSPVSCWA